MKNCLLEKVRKDNKVYFKLHIPYGDNKSFDLFIKPMFLSKKQFATLLRVSDDDKE